MANIITLREPLTFGKHSGLTGQQLMKSEDGTKYLVWIWNNTDIQMDAHIVNALAAHGFIDLKVERRNSRDGGAVSITPFAEHLNQQMLEDAINNAVRQGAMSSYERVLGNPINCRTNPVPYVQQVGRSERNEVTLIPPKPFLSKGDIVSRFRQMLDKERRTVDKLV